MAWAILCFERVLSFYGKELDEPLINAINIAKEWEKGKCSTGDAIKASREAHAFAGTIENRAACMVARAIGHGVATAHMADHSMGAALYAQKVLKLSGKSFEEERNVQVRNLHDLPDDLKAFIINMMKIKAKGLGL